MTDHVAYDSSGRPYIVNNNIIAPDAMEIVVSNLKREGLNDTQIQERVSDIEIIMMDSAIAQRHPAACARVAAKARLGLSDEDMEEIIAMTDPYQLTEKGPIYATRDSRGSMRVYLGWRNITHLPEDPSNPEYQEQDLRALAEA